MLTEFTECSFYPYYFRCQSKTIAEQTAEKINAKLGYRPPSEDEDGENSNAETFKRYEEELEINDFPQTARWKVTSKVSTGISYQAEIDMSSNHQTTCFSSAKEIDFLFWIKHVWFQFSFDIDVFK